MLNGMITFGPFRANLSSGELWRDATPVSVQDLPFRVLAALLESPGEVVSRNDLAARLWGSNTYVDATAGLNTAVAKLREALGDDAEHPGYIETVPKRGYRFIAPVSVIKSINTAAALEPFNERNSSGKSTRPRRLVWTAAAVFLVAGALFAAFKLRTDPLRTRVAVVLFDNETGRPEYGRLAQNLTDATVTELTTDTRLAVIGNAAVLRTERPFRDIAKVRDEVGADYIVIGQVQAVDDRTIVRTHLIRAADQSHLKVDVYSLSSGEAALQAEVSRGVRSTLTRALQSVR